MKPVEVYLVRHGETDWNAQFRFQGQTDVHLNEAGEAQARELAKILEHVKPDVFLSSDLKRAHRTAELANVSLQKQIVTHHHLRECGLGSMEGRFRDDVIRELGPEGWAKWTANDELDFALPGGETKRQVLKRALSCVQGFVGSRAGLERLAVITHGGVVKRIVHHALNSPGTKVELPNCVVHHVRYEPGPERWTYIGQLHPPAFD